MNDHEPYTVYSPKIPLERNETIPAAALQQKLVEFYTVFNPAAIDKGLIVHYLEFAKQQGVLALQRQLKKKYKCNLDEADASEAGRHAYYQNLVEFYRERDASKPLPEIEKVYRFAVQHGYEAVDQQLKGKYGISLSEFKSRPLTNWKNNWKTVLDHHHRMTLQYELERFYGYLDFASKGKKNKNLSSIQKLVEWGFAHTRADVNERLLNEYGMCLDDVKMVKGNTNSEREVNLRKQLVEFYQIHAPEKLSTNSQAPVIGQNRNSTDSISPELQQIYREVQTGIIHYERLNANLVEEYGVGLEDKHKARLKAALIDFYANRENKTDAAIEKILKYGLEKGVEAMNEKLVLKYGSGINIDDYTDNN